MRLQSADTIIVEEDITSARSVKTEDAVHDTRFARTVWAYDGVNLWFLHLEAEILDNV
jgi:hypothetical protein